MTRFFIIFRYITLLVACYLLASCLGGSIAQQIVSSIATRVADKAIANVMDVQDGPSNRKAENTVVSSNNNSNKNEALQNTPPDPYLVAFLNAKFEPVHAITEPLPNEFVETEVPIQAVQSSQLVRVELYNLLIGDEKNAVYEKARLLGATTLPKEHEWKRWCVGTGLNQTNKKMITFLIPPALGKLPSGSVTFVEIASPGELNVARYRDN